MFSFNIIFNIEMSINIIIKCYKEVKSDVVGIFTSPSIITAGNFKWTITIEMTIIWTVDISPSVFFNNEALVLFT